jgi:extracellular matrix regulatory protein A
MPCSGGPFSIYYPSTSTGLDEVPYLTVELLHVGFGSIVVASRVLAIGSPDSAPMRRLVRQAKDEGRLIDATYGRKTKAVLILDSGHILTAALQPETIAGRLGRSREGVKSE